MASRVRSIGDAAKNTAPPAGYRICVRVDFRAAVTHAPACDPNAFQGELGTAGQALSPGNFK
jgi:hypothetical protein